MIQKGQKRLNVNIDHVRDQNDQLARSILSQPFEYTLAFNHALKEIVRTLPQTNEDDISDAYYCAWAGSCEIGRVHV